MLSVHLEVGGGAAVLPAAQRLHGHRAAQRTRLLAVEPQAQALLAEHVLGTQPLSPPALPLPGRGKAPGAAPRLAKAKGLSLGGLIAARETFQRTTTPGLRGFLVFFSSTTFP